MLVPNGTVAEVTRLCSEMAQAFVAYASGMEGAEVTRLCSERAQAFVANASGMEGAEEPKFPSDGGFDLDDEAFLRELQGALSLDAELPGAGSGALFSDDDDADFWGSGSKEDSVDEVEEEEEVGEGAWPEGRASSERVPGGTCGIR